MGVVYLARDPVIDRLIALKTLRLDVDSDHEEQFRVRFLREARAAGRLNHRGIVTVYDVGQDPETGLVYIAMEYIEGMDLRHRIREGPPLSLGEIARIVAEIAHALDYAHSMGVIHRDIKPANILLTKDASPKVMDFGVARLESSNLTVEGQFIGTPNFMSPEQILGKPVDGRSDIFSLGVLLFSLLTGQRPFPGSTMHEVTMKIVREPAPVPSMVRPGLPTAFNPIVLKCLEKDPEKRFQCASEVARLLAALAGALVTRDPDDSARTGVFQPDLITRVEPSGATHVRTSSPRTGPIPIAKRSLRTRWDEHLRALPLPEFFFWDVEGRWTALILGTWILLLAIPVGILSFKIDRGPWPAPSPASIRARHMVVAACEKARLELNRGNTLGAEEAGLEALHQAPGSPGIRALLRKIHSRMEAESNSKETHLRAGALQTEGQSLYRQGRYVEAIDRFEECLKLEPDNEVATSYLELAREHAKLYNERKNRSRRPSSRKTSKHTLSGEKTGVAEEIESTGLATVSLHYDSPLNSGLITITIDDKPLTEISFDFTKKGFLGIKKKGRGVVEKNMTLPSGKHRIGIFLTSPEMSRPAHKVFEKTLKAESRWKLRIDQPGPGSTPSMFMLSSGR